MIVSLNSLNCTDSFKSEKNIKSDVTVLVVYNVQYKMLQNCPGS